MYLENEVMFYLDVSLFDMETTVYILAESILKTAGFFYKGNSRQSFGLFIDLIDSKIT